MSRFTASGDWEVAIFRGIKGRFVSETADYESGLAAWNEEVSHVAELLYMAGNLDKVCRQVEQTGLGVPLKTNERVLLVLRGSGIVELRASGGNQEDSRGVGYRVTNGVSYRAGAHDGRPVFRPEVQRIIDSDGTACITTHRVLYSSPNRNRAWEYSKTVDVFHSDTVTQDWRASYLDVSNRKKASGIIYRSGFAQSVRDRLVLGLAVAAGTLEDMVLALKEEMAELERL